MIENFHVCFAYLWREIGVICRGMKHTTQSDTSYGVSLLLVNESVTGESH